MVSPSPFRRVLLIVASNEHVCSVQTYESEWGDEGRESCVCPSVAIIQLASQEHRTFSTLQRTDNCAIFLAAVWCLFRIGTMGLSVAFFAVGSASALMSCIHR